MELIESFKKIDAEQTFSLLFVRKESLELDISLKKKKLKFVEEKIKDLKVYDWWNSESMCSSHEECPGGEACWDCDTPKEMWENRKKELMEKWTVK